MVSRQLFSVNLLPAGNRIINHDSLDDTLPPSMMNISRQNSADAIASGAVGPGYCPGLSRQNSGSMDGLLNTGTYGVSEWNLRITLNIDHMDIFS